MKRQENIATSPAIEGHEGFVEESYLQFLSEVREDIEEGHESDHLSAEFQEELSEIIFKKDLDHYHPLKFYWLNLIDKLVDTLALIEEELDQPSDLIGVFSESDLLGFVIERLEDEENIETIFEEVLEIQELQIISFFYLHISSDNWQPQGPVSYRPIAEIGEKYGHLFLGPEKNHCFLADYTQEAAIPIIGYFPSSKKLQVFSDQKIKEYQLGPNHKNLDHINVLPLLKSADDLSFPYQEKIKKACDVLKELTPQLWKNFESYTQNIIPIDTAKDEELVSFSMATLPGYSSINMGNRDFVDMVDDLLHENGHHFLNSLLEGEEEIIYEDDDKIFFSPWRRSLRPIRGLFHGFMTFYWAYRLFKELSLSDHLSKFFDENEKAKISLRFLEEAELIRSCQGDLDKAFQLKKISPLGKNLIDTVLQEVEADRSREEKIREGLSEESRQQLKEELEKVFKARLA